MMNTLERLAYLRQVASVGAGITANDLSPIAADVSRLQAERDQLRARVDAAEDAIDDIAGDRAFIRCLLSKGHELTRECAIDKPCAACRAERVVSKLRARVAELEAKLQPAQVLAEVDTILSALNVGAVLWREYGVQLNYADDDGADNVVGNTMPEAYDKLVSRLAHNE